MDTGKHTDVLIVGAGPAGLMMAAQLLRFGVQPVIIDAKRGPDRTSKAIELNASSMEHFRQMGLADKLLKVGAPARRIQVQGKGGTLGTLDFSQMEDPGTAYPFIHIAGQDITEKLLIERLTAGACPVIWETRLISLEQNDREATVTVDRQGQGQQWLCQWVIGADGADSSVRMSLFGAVRPRIKTHFFLADVGIRDWHHRHMHFFLSRPGLLAAIPFLEKGVYRLTGSLPATFSARDNIRYTDIKPIIDRAFGFELPVEQCHWISSFPQYSHVADKYSRQRTFLIGDAAHVHMPFTAQSMNAGIQDAVNLAWKLAGVLQGRTASSLLHSYEEERLPEAHAIARTTDRLFRWISGTPAWLYSFRDSLISKLLRDVNADPRHLRHVFGRIGSSTGRYRKSSLSVHHATAKHIQAGDRLPFMVVFDERTKRYTDLHRWCERPGFILLIMGTISAHQLHIIGQWVRQKYGQHMHLYYLPYSPNNLSLFEAFEVKRSATKIMLIRPDMHIAYMNDMLNMSLIDTYMEEVLRWKLFGPLTEKT